MKIGDVAEFDSFSSAVIDDKAFSRITGYIEHAKKSPNLEIIGGGQYDKRLLLLYLLWKIKFLLLIKNF